MVHFGLTVDDVALEGYSSVAHLEGLLEFCAAEGVHATFCVVPCPNEVPLSERPEYGPVLRRARAEGHEVAQHGLTHSLFEVGVPPEMVLNLPHEAENRRRWREEPGTILADLGYERVRQRLRQGRESLEEFVAAPVVGFRAPALQWGETLSLALREEGYWWDSSRYLQPAGWALINGEPAIPRAAINREAFDHVQQPGGPVELPLTTDYVWYLTRDRVEASWELALHDLKACVKAGIPFVTVCHVSPVWEGDENCGISLLRRLLQAARELADERGEAIRFATLGDIAEHYSGGEAGQP